MNSDDKSGADQPDKCEHKKWHYIHGNFSLKGYCIDCGQTLDKLDKSGAENVKSFESALDEAAYSDNFEGSVSGFITGANWARQYFEAKLIEQLAHKRGTINQDLKAKLAERDAEIEKLRAENVVIYKVVRENEKLTAASEALVEALEKYTEHETYKANVGDYVPVSIALGAIAKWREAKK